MSEVVFASQRAYVQWIMDEFGFTPEDVMRMDSGQHQILAALIAMRLREMGSS